MPRKNQPRKVKECEICKRLFAASEKFKTCSNECTVIRQKLKHIEWKENNKEYHRSLCRRYYHENKESRAAYNKEYAKENKGRLGDYRKKRRAENPEKFRKEFYTWHVKKLATCPKYKMLHTMRTRIGDVMRKIKTKKHANTISLLGCDLNTFMDHMESLFALGMTWKNHGLYGWHVDHKKPCDAFDLTKPEHQRQCFNYTNLQPLWAKDNIKKGSKYSGD